MARSVPKAGATTVDGLRGRLAAGLHSRFALRIHTSILLLWTFSAGLLTTKGLLLLGVHSMFFRYTIAIVVAYGAFLLGVRLWLKYVGASGGAARAEGEGSASRRANRSGSSVDLTDLIPSGRGGGSATVFGGQGGASGGAGASIGFDGGASSTANLLAADSAGLVASSSDGTSAGSGLLDGIGDKVGDAVGEIGGADDGCLVAFAIMIVIGLIALAIGGAVFVISMGPEVLIDAAFNAMLSGGLIKAGARVSDPDWMGSVIKATWKPLAIVLVMAWVFTATAAVLTPTANTFGETMRIVWPKLLEAM